ncbi:MAG: hypothetical protein ACRC80_16415 [Waterburya sp.]
MKEALQWWYQKKSRQLESEANLIREQVLQESFAMRRSLELSSIKSNEFATSSGQKCLEQLENFHLTLKELSDRLSPPCINEGLPWALQYLVKKWQKKNPSCQIELNLPLNWQQKSQAHNFVILNILEDLWQIHLLSENNFIFINLKQNTINNQLNHQLKAIFIKQDKKLLTSKNSQELKYIQKSFEYLMSGSCQNLWIKDSNIWSFQW